MRKRLAGIALTDRRTAGFGEGLYTAEMSRRTYSECMCLAAELLACGWAVVVDGAFSAVTERAEARALAERVGAGFSVIWCDAPDAVLIDRLRQRAGDSHEISDARPDVLVRHRTQYEAPANEPDTIRVDTTSSENAAVASLLRALAER